MNSLGHYNDQIKEVVINYTEFIAATLDLRNLLTEGIFIKF